MEREHGTTGRDVRFNLHSRGQPLRTIQNVVIVWSLFSKPLGARISLGSVRLGVGACIQAGQKRVPGPKSTGSERQGVLREILPAKGELVESRMVFEGFTIRTVWLG